ncbi:hypothetical protein K8R33_02550 [archaeon]|nr:hypothetical protein [archaeon]
MPIVGFNFEKITIEKTSQITGKLNIKNDLSIKSLEQEKLNLTSAENVLKFNFEFLVNYEPKVGKINLNGNVLYMEDEKKVKEILDGWKKDKKLPEDLAPQILNTILAKCNIKALSLTQEVNLPPHIRLPVLKPK